MSDKRDSPFASLQRLRDSLPPGTANKAEPAPATKGPARAVVRLERKHRGGKEVTVIEKLELKPDALAAWCKELKQALGCGGSVEGDAIMLQGDLRQRVPAVLTKKGVGTVTVSG